MRNHWKRILSLLLVVCMTGAFWACGDSGDAAHKGVVISEVVLSNGKSYEDETYGSPDWIELHNESDHEINLLGWGVTDNVKNEDKTCWLPEIVLPADGYVVLLATKLEKTEPFTWDGESPICLGFSLKSAGEDIVLINANLEVVCEVAVPALNRDVSYARRSDGSYGYASEPTPGKANDTDISSRQPDPVDPEPEHFEPVRGLEISEVSPRNTMLSCGGCLKCDWVELHNTTNSDLSIDGFTLCDEKRDYDDANLSGTIPANGYLVVYCCDETCTTKDAHVCVDLGINRYGETLYLFDAHGNEIGNVTVPEIPYKDVTYARRADGTYGYCEIATPGAENNTEITDEPPVREEETPEPTDPNQDDTPVDPTINAKRSTTLRISEVLPKNAYSIADRDGDRSDWVEIVNTADQPIDLSEWYLSDNPKNLKKWAFPKVSLPAGAYRIIFLSGKNVADDHETELHTNFSLGTGETLYLYNDRTGVLDWITVPELNDNVSIGFNESNEQVYYRYPTPNEPNGHGDQDAEALGFFPSDGVYISEVCAIHGRGTGEKDWIELHNGGSGSVSLDGWYLSDSINDLKKFQITSRTIEAGGYAVFETTSSYANRSSGDGTFGIDPSGETLYLSDSSGNLRDVFETGVQRLGMTSGRIENDAHTRRVFYSKPTKGAKNTGETFPGYVSEPTFSETALYHTEPFQLTLSSLTPGAIICYTTDGSEPSLTSSYYSGPIPISSNSVIRAAAFRDGLLSSEIVTFHYLFEKPHTLPVVCIAMAPKDFDTVYKVKEHSQIKERKGYVNYYESDGLIGTTFPCDIKAKGRGTLKYIAQRSLTLSLRAEYGKSSVEYPFFPGYEFTEFSAFALRQAGQDYSDARLRDAFVSRACLGLNVDCANSRFCIVYVNGKYYGIHDFNEELNSKYLQTHFGVDEDTVNTIMRNGSIAMKGTNTEFKKVFNAAKSADLSSDSAYEQFIQKVDPDAFIDYVICRQFMVETDSFNQKYWRTTDYRIRWRPILYDLDYCFFSSGAERNMAHLYFNKEGTPSNNGSITHFYFTVALRTNAGWRQKFIERYVELVMTRFSAENLTALLDQVASELEPEMERHIARWNHPKSVSAWKNSVESLRNKLIKRPAIVLEHLRKEFKLSTAEMDALIAKYTP